METFTVQIPPRARSSKNETSSGPDFSRASNFIEGSEALEWQDFSELEAWYQETKRRLHNAQRNKMEATTEFLAAREALSQRLEMLWPGQKE